jgi:biotin transport system substrate-specific component
VTIALPRMNRLPVAERGITIADFLVPIRIGERLTTRARHLALIAAGALLIALGARISIVLPGNPVPITGQTFGVLVAGGALGFRRGIASTALYLALGIVGLPFFALGKTGLQVLWGSTGGYLVGFVVAAAIVGRLAELGWDRKLIGSVGAMLIASVAIYAIGVPWLAVSTFHGDLGAGITYGLVPFVVGDAIKLALAASVFPAAWWFVGRGTEER